MQARLTLLSSLLLMTLFGCGTPRRAASRSTASAPSRRISLPRLAALESAPDFPAARRAYPKEIDPKRVSSDPTWGYLKNNPIKVGGPSGVRGPASQRLYLDHLRDSNFLALSYRRLGSVGSGRDGHVVDLYELTGVDGRKYRLHLDMYHPEINPLDLVAPAGMFFHLRAAVRAPISDSATIIANLPRAEKPMREAEREYQLALRLWRELGGSGNRVNRRRKYLNYVLASQNYLLALVNHADDLQAETSRRRAHARGAAVTIENWLAAQTSKKYRLPPPAVRIWMYYHLGRAWSVAGDDRRACSAGYDRVLAVSPGEFPTATSRAWAWQMRLTCGYLKARILVAAANSSADWEKALGACGGELLSRPETLNTALRVRARTLKLRCLVALGRGETALAEYRKGRAEADGLKGSEAAAAGRLKWELIRAIGPDKAPLADMTKLASPEVMVATGLSLYRQKRFEEAARLLRAVIIQGSGLSFARRCNPGGEPRAWLLLGMSYTQLKKPVRAQQAWESALNEFWEKMPEEFRKNPANSRTVRDLRDLILTPCARKGRLGAALRYNSTRQKADLDRLRRFMQWEERLTGKKRAR